MPIKKPESSPDGLTSYPESVQAHPAPGLHGAGLGVTLALAVYAAAVVTAISVGWARRGLAAQAVVIGLIGGCGVALAALQPHGPVEIAASLGVWIAAVRLPLVPAVAAAAAITAALAVAVGLTEHPAVQSAITAALLCLLLAVTGRFIRRGRKSQDRTGQQVALRLLTKPGTTHRNQPPPAG